MKRLLMLGVGIGMAGAFAAPLEMGEEDMFPFVISYDAQQNAANMSHLVEGPAGKNGRIRIVDGRFADDKGPVRFHATNLTGPANFPTHEEAKRLGDRLLRFGINCVRLHYFDSDYATFMLPREPGIIVDDFRTKRRMSAEMLDRMHFMIAEFKKRGIYVNINLHVARWLDERDGFASPTPWANKGLNLWHEQLIEIQKEYARQLMCPVNPYTGMNMLDDPVVAMVELNNEEGLHSEYLFGEMSGLKDPYKTMWRNLWNDWLLKKYGCTKNIFEAWKCGSGCAEKKPNAVKLKGLAAEKGEIPAIKFSDVVPDEMRRDFFRFTCDVERKYWKMMQDYLQKDLGLKAPVSGTQLEYSPPWIQAELDYVDNHRYWCHPHFKNGWSMKNEPLVNALGESICQLAGQRIAGRPYTISEYNHPYPNFYGAEGQIMLRAYGAFQGWDGVFEYSYNNRLNAEPDFNEYMFSIVARTDVLAHFPACAAMYLRGDVKEGADMLMANLEHDAALDRLAFKMQSIQGVTEATEGAIPKHAPLVRKVALDAECKSPKVASGLFPAGKAFTSSTGELHWNCEKEGAGYMTVDTDNVKVFTGFPAGRKFDIGGVELEIGKTKLGWATVSLTSRFGTGFGADGKSATVLVAATGLSLNKGAKFEYDEKTRMLSGGADWGRGPVMNEGIPAALTLPSKAAKTKCWALDEAGNRTVEVPVAEASAGRAAIGISPKYRTVWYEIAVAP